MAAREPDARIVWPAAHRPASALVFAQNAIDIAATPEAVWAQLLDCVRWPSCYARCSDVSILRGPPMLGADSRFRFKTFGMFFEPEVVTFEPLRLLVWTAKGPLGTSGSHAWLIDRTPGGCRVITEEAQIGTPLRFLRTFTRGRLLAAHDEWLRGLKLRVEGCVRPD